MNTYQLLCLDIDGTLLNSKHQITKETRAAIQKVQKEKGIPVVLVSARMPRSIFPLAQELGICAPIICYSGALVMDSNKKTVLRHYIEASYIQKLYFIGKKYRISMSLYKDNEWYVEKKDTWTEQEEKITHIPPIIHDYQTLFTSWAQEGCNKILCMGDEEEIRALKNKLIAKFQGNLTIYLSKTTYLEIMPNLSSKTSAIKVLLEKYNIDQKALMVIGDNYNDMDMIQFAGLGIAMGNAPEEVKGCSDAITLSNDEDGVVFAINKYIL